MKFIDQVNIKVSAGNGGNENNRFGSSFAKGDVETFPNTNYSYNVHP